MPILGNWHFVGKWADLYMLNILFVVKFGAIAIKLGLDLKIW